MDKSTCINCSHWRRHVRAYPNPDHVELMQQYGQCTRVLRDSSKPTENPYTNNLPSVSHMDYTCEHHQPIPTK